jgi:hypothetical protein
LSPAPGRFTLVFESTMLVVVFPVGDGDSLGAAQPG